MPLARSRRLFFILIAVIITILSSCREDRDPTTDEAGGPRASRTVGAQVAQEQPSLTPTNTSTPPPTLTPLPSATPTITPTPTATAPPILLSGNPLASAIHDAAPQAGAPCGVVDLLDFPLDPPDALDIFRGGQDFNVFRDRYDGYHAGEDWWGPGGRGGSFGEPVYSIGHGQVTFAHPYGWGIDQGTVILRHVYPDGTEFYSFYGHLDPPSVEGLSFGQCVTRGQKIGEIGRPRGSPHLHFEMRYHTPSDPGPGYWSHDPRRSGWLAPSHTISTWRIAVSPGVLWQRTDLSSSLQGIAVWNPDTLIAASGTDVVGYGAHSGSEQWRVSTVANPDEDDETLSPISATAFDALAPILYAVDRSGRITALRLPTLNAEGVADPAQPQLLWDLDLYNLRGAPTLIPLPSGGVALAVQRRMIALSPAGALLWRQAFDARPVDWLQWQDTVLVSTSGENASLWQINADGPMRWQEEGMGRLVESGGDPFLYDGNAVYRLDPSTQAKSLFYELPDGLSSQSDLSALPDGGLLLAHMDAGGRRLIALDATGSLRWQRVYSNRFDGVPRLLWSANELYLFSEESGDSWSRVYLHRIDLQNEKLTLVFSGGTRTPLPGSTWLFSAETGQFLINIGGGSLLALDAGQALQVVCADGASPGC